MNFENHKIFGKTVNEMDEKIAQIMSIYGIPLLRISIGIVFFWFGILKPFGLSSAQELVENTVFFIEPQIFIPILGIWEVLIGISLIVKRLNRLGILLLFAQMPGTFLPLILLPDVTWSGFLVPTLEGQYIIKNLVLISAGLVIGSRVRSETDTIPMD